MKIYCTTTIIGKVYSFDITNIYRNVYNPKIFIIISFQKGRLNQEYDNSKFDGKFVNSISV